MKMLAREVAEPVVGMEIDLGGGWIFCVEEVVEHPVDPALTTSALLAVMDSTPELWKRLGTAPADDLMTSRSLIGRMNQRWTESGLRELLSTADCRLKGSGRWVLEGFMSLRLMHDGKGWIFFAGDENSCWEDALTTTPFFPALYPAPTGKWSRTMAECVAEWSRETRICLRWM